MVITLSSIERHGWILVISLNSLKYSVRIFSEVAYFYYLLVSHATYFATNGYTDR